MAERNLIDHAYTISNDQGDDLEERLARRVSTGLRISHTIVRPREEPFASEMERACERVEYQSLLHLAIQRLDREIPSGGICVDGFAGPLIKGRYLKAELLAARDPVAATFDRMVAQRRPAMYGDAWITLRATARESFLRENRRFDGVPVAPMLVRHTRSRYANGTSPIAVFGRRRRLFVPLIENEISRAALATPVDDLRAQRLIRAVLTQVNPKVGPLPSTNDLPKPERQWRPRLRKRDARAAHHALLARSPLRPWFGGKLSRLVDRGAIAPLDGRPGTIRLMQALCMFTLWSERYANLVAVDPAELLGPPSAGRHPSATLSRSSSE